MDTRANEKHCDQSSSVVECPTLHCRAAYAESDREKLFAFIESTVLGSIITSTADEGILVNQIPFTLARDANADAACTASGDSVFGSLQCHFPRQNEAQLQAILENPKQQIVIVFNGPNHYISANWFPSKHRTHKFVPTWNYATVNVTARVRRITESGPNFMKDASTFDACSGEGDSSEKNNNADSADCERTEAQVRNATHRAFLRNHLDRLSAVCENLVGEERPWMLSDAPVSFLDGLYTQLVGIELDILRIDGKIKAVQNKPTEVDGVVRGLQRLLDEGEARYGQKSGTNATSSMCPLGTLRLAKDGGLLHSNTKSSGIKLETACRSKEGGKWYFTLPTSIINCVLIACLAAIFAAFALQRETA